MSLWKQPGHRDAHLVGDVGVELDLGAVAERDALPDRVVLGGQLDRERGRQVRLSVAYVADTRYVAPVWPVPIGVTSTSRTSAPSTEPSHAGVTSAGPRGMLCMSRQILGRGSGAA